MLDGGACVLAGVLLLLLLGGGCVLKLGGNFNCAAGWLSASGEGEAAAAGMVVRVVMVVR